MCLVFAQSFKMELQCDTLNKKGAKNKTLGKITAAHKSRSKGKPSVCKSTWQEEYPH